MLPNKSKLRFFVLFSKRIYCFTSTLIFIVIAADFRDVINIYLVDLIFMPFHAHKYVKILVFSHFLKPFPLISHQSWFTCHVEQLIEMLIINIGLRGLIPVSFCAPRQIRIQVSCHLLEKIPLVLYHSYFTCSFGVRYLCASIMCPKGRISGPTVKVAVKLVRPPGLFFEDENDLIAQDIWCLSAM